MAGNEQVGAVSLGLRKRKLMREYVALTESFCFDACVAFALSGSVTIGLKFNFQQTSLLEWVVLLEKNDLLMKGFYKLLWILVLFVKM